MASRRILNDCFTFKVMFLKSHPPFLYCHRFEGTKNYDGSSFSIGSWYITDLCQALQEYGHILPIKNVLHKTRKNLKERVESMNNTYITQLSEEKDTLTRYCNFFSFFKF